MYSPLMVGEAKGTLTIFNSILGELWYDLKLIGHKSPP
jgi:hypothetical protein